jgi:hypothetical protein
MAQLKRHRAPRIGIGFVTPEPGLALELRGKPRALVSKARALQFVLTQGSGASFFQASWTLHAYFWLPIATFSGFISRRARQRDSKASTLPSKASTLPSGGQQQEPSSGSTKSTPLVTGIFA